MNFFLNMRISHKISALMIGLVLGFIAIGVTYYVQINIDKGTRQDELKAFEYQNKLTELNLLHIQMEGTANQLLLSKEPRLVDIHSALGDEVETKIRELERTKITPENRRHVDGIKTLTEKHHEIFERADEELGAYGYSANEGIRANLASSRQTVESILENNASNEALSSYRRLNRSIDSYVLEPSADVLPQINSLRIAFEESIVSAGLPADALRNVVEEQENYRKAFEEVVSVLGRIESISEELNELDLETSLAFSEALQTSKTSVETILTEASERTQATQASVTAIIFIVAMGTAISIYFIYKSIIFPMTHMLNVIKRINRGKTNARVKMIKNDELGELGKAFNQLFDERIQQLEEQSLENDRLNNSIISLIKAVGLIARKDLTIKVPVSSDITGTVSDAVNLLTSETAKTLRQVRDVSDEVNDVSEQLQNQSQLVMQFADNERRQVIATSKALEVLSRAMTDVARRSETADNSASQAIENTQMARKTVIETVTGIRTIRETISEAEKRMKRLGDRSQEVSGIVNLINTIAERTHILALNASMHAASAGEAGKGFAVVADEVQRLAESARESTDEISAMVNNMRVETSDTVNIMNTLISQVADGSRLAEQAGERMEATESATEELVQTVKLIADQAVQQADVAKRIRDRASIIRNFTEKTGKQLEEQKSQTDSLKQCANKLVERVNVFVLPEDSSAAVEQQKQVAPPSNVEQLQTAS